MKTNRILIKFSCFLAGMWLSGCSNDEFLSVTDQSAVTSATTFAAENTADLFLNDIYNNLPDLNQDDLWDPTDNISDNSMSGFSWPISRAVYARQATTLTPASDFAGSHSFSFFQWWGTYERIRKCNVYIQGVEGSSLSEEYKKQRIGEAKALRAFFYHNLWLRYGGVPLISKPDNQSVDGDAIFHARASADETFAFVIKDLDDAITDLKTNNGNDGRGRITKGAAMMLKSYVQLFQASPLRNPSNDKARWATAAASAKAIFSMGYALFPRYDQLFWSSGNNNNEGIMYREYYARVKPSLIHTKYGPGVLGTRWLSWGGTNPTQNLVNDYCMRDGRPITDAKSGYNPQDPYKNREPRFYQSILYNGSMMHGLPYTTAINAGSNNQIDLSNTNDNTNTGYSQRKRMDESVDLYDWGASSQNYYYFRYAEALLIYAEAQNEASGPDASVYDAIDQIRVRAGIPKLSEVYPGLSQNEMREAIRRERRIELAFEDKRYLDLLRWKTAEIELNKPSRAMKITRENNGTLLYEEIDAADGDRSFNPTKNYLLPLPPGVLGQNKSLVQNPGYN